jgi:FxLD family lantipeptide
MSTTELKPETSEPAEADSFDLDIRVIESGDAAASLINVTDNGCGSTCASPCVTNCG